MAEERGTDQRSSDSPMTAADLKEVSGYQQPSKQLEWVRENLKLEPAKRRDGRPSLTWGVYSQALLARRPGSGHDDAAMKSTLPTWKRPV